MLLHLVLFEPKGELTPDQRRALVDSIERAAREIPTVRRFEIGRRLADGPTYLVGAPPALTYVAIVGFDDRAGLDAYLAHDAHLELGRLFNQTLAAAFVYDYEAGDAGEAGGLLVTSDE